jgi:hypothetical protein
MSWGSPVFVLVLIAISMIGWVITTAIRARHGYPVEGEWGGKVDHPSAARTTQLLEAENEMLRGKLGRVEERIAVLERIATDPAKRLSSEIETLRDADRG